MNDATFTEKFKLKFTPLAVFVTVVLSALTLIFFTSAFIAFTPLREYIPGYGSLEDNQQIHILGQRVDSLQQTLESISIYGQDVKTLLLGKGFNDDTAVEPEFHDPKQPEFIQTQYDSILLSINMSNTVKINQENKTINRKSSVQPSYSVRYPPVYGIVAKGYANDHKSVDFMIGARTSIFSSQGGIVTCVHHNIADQKSLLIIQHPNNVLSVYRFSGIVLVTSGEPVKAGQSIAQAKEKQIVNYELWINGMIVNPLDYISI